MAIGGGSEFLVQNSKIGLINDIFLNVTPRIPFIYFHGNIF
jgi:hypothetical protein